jgi:hypothetical protein
MMVSCAVEGDLDAIVARRLLSHVDLSCGPIYGGDGKAAVRRSIQGYACGAKHSRWFVLVDLDNDHQCASSLVTDWLPEIPELMSFRVAVREIEAWLLADRIGIASFLSVSPTRIPRNPEGIDKPKASMLDIAGRSRIRAIREGVPPRPGSGRTIGPIYVTELARFVQQEWDVDAASTLSPSLERCLAGLRALR